jgi:pilus assembly protein CpaE
MELSLRKGVLANILDIVPRYTTTDLIKDIQRVDSYILQAALTEVAENFYVLAGPYETIQAEKVDLNNTMQLVQLTRHLADWVVLDVPSTYDDLFFRTLTTADRIVLVADQSVAGIRGVQMVCESLGDRHPLVLINRYNSSSTLSVERIKEFLPKCDVCTLVNDGAVAASMNDGLPLRLHTRRSPALSNIDALLRNFDVGLQADGGMKNDSVLSRLGRALSLSKAPI